VAKYISPLSTNKNFINYVVASLVIDEFQAIDQSFTTDPGCMIGRAKSMLSGALGQVNSMGSKSNVYGP
jgi:hypothetical protein